MFGGSDMLSDARCSKDRVCSRAGRDPQMFRDACSQVAGSAPNVAGITCRTSVFVYEVGTEISVNLVLVLEPRAQVSATFEDYPKK